jgi:hypothetical protein
MVVPRISQRRVWMSGYQYRLKPITLIQFNPGLL